MRSRRVRASLRSALALLALASLVLSWAGRTDRAALGPGLTGELVKTVTWHNGMHSIYKVILHDQPVSAYVEGPSGPVADGMTEYDILVFSRCAELVPSVLGGLSPPDYTITELTKWQADDHWIYVPSVVRMSLLSEFTMGLTDDAVRRENYKLAFVALASLSAPGASAEGQAAEQLAQYFGTCGVSVEVAQALTDFIGGALEAASDDDLKKLGEAVGENSDALKYASLALSAAKFMVDESRRRAARWLLISAFRSDLAGKRLRAVDELFDSGHVWNPDKEMRAGLREAILAYDQITQGDYDQLVSLLDQDPDRYRNEREFTLALAAFVAGGVVSAAIMVPVKLLLDAIIDLLHTSDTIREATLIATIHRELVRGIRGESRPGISAERARTVVLWDNVRRNAEYIYHQQMYACLTEFLADFSPFFDFDKVGPAKEHHWNGIGLALAHINAAPPPLFLAQDIGPLYGLLAHPTILSTSPTGGGDVAYGEVPLKLQVVPRASASAVELRYGATLSESTELSDPEGDGTWTGTWDTSGLTPGQPVAAQWAVTAAAGNPLALEPEQFRVVASDLQLDAGSDKGSYYPPEDVQLWAQVALTGAPVTGANVRYTVYRDGKPQMSGPFTDVPGKPGEYEASFNAPDIPDLYDVDVDATHGGHEGSTVAFSLEVVAVGEGADIKIPSLTVRPIDPEEGNIIRLGYRVENQSDIPAMGIHVESWLEELSTGSKYPVGEHDGLGVPPNDDSGSLGGEWPSEGHYGTFDAVVEAFLAGDPNPTDNRQTKRFRLRPKNPGAWWGPVDGFYEVGEKLVQPDWGWYTLFLDYDSHAEQIHVDVHDDGGQFRWHEWGLEKRRPRYSNSQFPRRSNFVFLLLDFFKHSGTAWFHFGAQSGDVSVVAEKASVRPGEWASFVVGGMDVDWNTPVSAVGNPPGWQFTAQNVDRDEWRVKLHAPADAATGEYGFSVYSESNTETTPCCPTCGEDSCYHGSVYYLEPTVYYVHDIAVNQPEGPATGHAGQELEVVVDLTNNGDADEPSVDLELTIDGPAGYRYECPKEGVPVAKGATERVLLPWDARDAVEGDYDITILAELEASDTTPSDNLAEAQCHLGPREKLVVAPRTDRASYPQDAPITLTVELTDESQQGVAEADVTYTLTDAKGQARHGEVTEVGGAVYETTMAAPDVVGPFTLSVEAIHARYDSGQADVPGPLECIDEREPETHWVSPTPAEGELVNRCDVIVCADGVDYGNPPADVQYSFQLDGSDWTAFSAEHGHTFDGLDDGPHTVAVRGKDKAGNIEATPAERQFSVDTVAPTFDDPPSVLTPSCQDGDEVCVELDMSEEIASAWADFSALDSAFDPGSILLELVDGNTWLYRVRYTISAPEQNRTPDGMWPIQLRMADRAENESPSRTLEIQLENESPSVAGHYPQGAETPVNGPIVVQFSEPMDQPATEGAIKLQRRLASQRFQTVSWTADWFGNTAMLKPARPLVAGSYHRVFVNTNATDASGNPLPKLVRWGFTTVSDQAPVLSWLGVPEFEADGVSPDTGQPGTTRFTFKVRLTDIDGDEPGFVRLILWRDGEEWKTLEMTPRRGSTQYGRVYVSRRRLPVGNYRYRFAAEDKDGTATGQPTVLRVGPVMPAPPYLSWRNTPGFKGDGIHPNTGTANDTRFRFQVVYHAHDGDMPDYVRIVFWRDGRFHRAFRLAQATMSPDPLEGVLYRTRRRLPAGNYEYQFQAQDQHGEARGPAAQRMRGPTVTSAGSTVAITSLSCMPMTGGGAQATFVLSQAGEVEARVLNIAGRQVRSLCRARTCEAGCNVLLWNAQSDRGLSVPSGAYLIEVAVRGPDGSQARALTHVRISR